VEASPQVPSRQARSEGQATEDEDETHTDDCYDPQVDSKYEGVEEEFKCACPASDAKEEADVADAVDITSEPKGGHEQRPIFSSISGTLPIESSKNAFTSEAFIEVAEAGYGRHRRWSDQIGDDHMALDEELSCATDVTAQTLPVLPLFSGVGPTCIDANALFERLRAAHDEATCFTVDVAIVKRFNRAAASHEQLSERLHLFIDLASLFEHELEERDRIDKIAPFVEDPARPDEFELELDSKEAEVTGEDAAAALVAAPKARGRRGGRRNRRFTGT
jgi:hypothetical protein